MQPDDDVAAMTYESALAELDGLITRLEGGSVPLDEAIACYERGSRLARHCQELLDQTDQKVTQLVVGEGGRMGERPLDVEEPAPAAERAVPGRGVAPTRPPRDINPDDIPF